MDVFRSTKQYRTEIEVSMDISMVRVIGVDDDMVYAIVSPEDFEQQYEVIPE